MRTTIHRIAVAVALLVLCGTVAAAEMKVDVPFHFTAPGATLPAGTYFITSDALMPVFRFQHAETGKMVLVSAPVRLQSNAAQAFRIKPAIEFRCVDQACSLSAILDAGSREGHALIRKSAPARTIAAQTVVIDAE